MKLAFRFNSNSTTFIQIQQNFSQRTGFSDVLIRFPFLLFFSSFLRFWPPKIGQSGHSREARQLYRAANSIYRIKTDGYPMILFLFVLLICAQDGWIDRATYVYISDPHGGVKWWSSSPWIGEIRGLQGRLVLLLSSLHFAICCPAPTLSLSRTTQSLWMHAFVHSGPPAKASWVPSVCLLLPSGCRLDPCLSISLSPPSANCSFWSTVHCSIIIQTSASGLCLDPRKTSRKSHIGHCSTL